MYDEYAKSQTPKERDQKISDRLRAARRGGVAIGAAGALALVGAVALVKDGISQIGKPATADLLAKPSDAANAMMDKLNQGKNPETLVATLVRVPGSNETEALGETRQSSVAAATQLAGGTGADPQHVAEIKEDIDAQVGSNPEIGLGVIVPTEDLSPDNR